MSLDEALPERSWRKLELFRTLSERALDELEASLTTRHFAPGEVLLKQGAEGQEMFLLAEGRVRIEIREGGVLVHARELEAPEALGEIALVTREPRSATVCAVTPVVADRLDRAGFDALVAEHPPVAAFVTEVVGKRLLQNDSIRAVGKYQVTGRIGSGGAATVFEAIHPELGRPVALKMLSHALVLQPGFAEAFQKEARMVAGMHHDNVVQVLDTEQAWSTRFIVMERLNGILLEDMVAEQGPLGPDLVRLVLVDVLDALQYAHQRGLLHRDIKPSNVFYTKECRAKILDFGIAVELERAGGVEGRRLGTPYYMPPEQILGRAMDGRSDLYSTGIMAYEMVTGRVPFDGDTVQDLFRAHVQRRIPDPRELRPDLPDDLRRFIRRAAAKHPDDRFASCGEAAAFLREEGERSRVGQADLLSLAITLHPSRREEVLRAVEALEQALGGLSGVRWTRAGIQAQG